MTSLLLLAGCAEAPKAQAQKEAEIPVFPAAPDTARFFWERSIYSSADVVADAKDGSLRRMLTGEVRTGEGLGKPYGVAARNGRIYVGDTLNRVVVMYDLNAKTYTRIGVEDPGSLRMPFGLDLDDQNNLYVVDGTLKRVQVYDAKGKFLRVMGQDIKWSRPAGLAIDNARKRLYVVDVGGVSSNDHLVRVLDLETGKHLSDIGTRGEGPGQFNLPRDAVVGADGLLYVVDGGNFRVQVFDADGKFVKTFGTIGRQSGQFARPKEIAADRDGNIYVIDTAFGNFQIFNPQGELLLNVGGRSNVDGPARFMLPSGIAVDSDGRIYVVDQYFKKVDVFRPAALPASAHYGPTAPAATAAPAAAPATAQGPTARTPAPAATR
ncbi:6-bladed beta-propeller [Ramlibacter alkalitolerans]|uniref:6-bladed beta-propeller n=1 Tax=Ramlibacter alkalitolerans TaxID=2039631 RepID=A0ABS1JJ95_9BURK|nr:6-bladed beta-propeller [Ramlibacter alkalitolerans]MBL0424176.1 6-bladed beta-propeller [Ramlibacter alkalitolerans]